MNKSWRSAWCKRAELSDRADSDTRRLLMETMYYIGLDVHKKTIDHCVKDGIGRIYTLYMRAGHFLRVLLDTPILCRTTRDCKFPPVKSCDGTVGHPLRFLNVPSPLTNGESLRVVGGQHRSSPHGEVFAVSADLGELQHHGCIEPAVPGFGIESLQGFFGMESSSVRAIGSQCIIDVRDL